MKFGVIVYPGSNCDEDMVWVLRDVMQQNVVKLWHKSHDLENCDFLIVPGGFAYGDYLRAGAIARFSPIMNEVVKHAENGGYVWGICNGFQILTEARLLEGTLLHNDSHQYVCKNTYLKTSSKNTLLTQNLDTTKAYKIPIAHGEGKYYASDETLKKLNDYDQILFKYVDELGNATSESNPNGSLENIAGITNEQRNVFGMMPHPERAAHEFLGNTDGRIFFESLLNLVM